jgi:hypothetical protein
MSAQCPCYTKVFSPAQINIFVVDQNNWGKYIIGRDKDDPPAFARIKDKL